MTITAARLRELLQYDQETGEWRWRSTCPSPRHRGRVAGTAINDGYLGIKVDGRRYLAHRLAFLYVTGAWPLIEVDHENGQRKDNRWLNLREADDQQNSANRKPHRDRALKCKGVTLVSARGIKRQRPYAATICVKGKKQHLGVFETEEDAHSAYVVAAVAAFGTFARRA